MCESTCGRGEVASVSAPVTFSHSVFPSQDISYKRNRNSFSARDKLAVCCGSVGVKGNALLCDAVSEDVCSDCTGIEACQGGIVAGGEDGAGVVTLPTGGRERGKVAECVSVGSDEREGGRKGNEKERNKARESVPVSSTNKQRDRGGGDGVQNVVSGCLPLEPKTFRMLHWNVSGLLPKLQDQDFINYISSFDFICLVETFVDAIQLQFLTDHTIFVQPALRFTRQGRASGGVAVIIRNTFLKLIKRIECHCCNHISFLVDKSLFGFSKNVLIVCVYVHPENSPYYVFKNVENGISHLEDCIIDNILKLGDINLVVCGDLNCRTSDLLPEMLDTEFLHDFSYNPDNTDIIRNSEDTILNNYGKKLLHMCSTLGLCMLNGICKGDQKGLYTYISDTGNSVNDYVLVSVEVLHDLLNMSTLKIVDRIESDHMPLEFTLNFKQVITSSVNNKEMDKQEIKVTKYTWNNDFSNTFLSNLNTEYSKHCLNTAEVLIETDVNAALTMFNNCIKQQAQNMKRKVLSDKNNRCNSWFDFECREARRTVRRALRRFRKTLMKEDRVYFCKIRREYKNMLHLKKKIYNEGLLNRLLTSANDQQQFWQEINKIIFKRVFIKNNINIDDWYNHFKAILEKSNDMCEHFQGEVEVYSEDLDGRITRNEIIAAIKKLKVGKSAGPDEMIGEFFKYSGDSLITFLEILFNKLFDEGIYPESWKESIIIPLFKKGDINNPNNYRGISLCNITSKLYGSIINNRLQKWIELYNITGECQAGFKKDYSTLDHIFTLLAIIQKQFAQNSKLYVAFVDFEKAFDSISRKLLWPILRKHGICGKLYKCIRSMYEDVKAKVRDGAKFTDYINCTHGVKQGDICSPILFSLFINELAIEIIQNGKHGIALNFDLVELFVLLFADDLVLLSYTVIGLQTQLNNLYAAATRLELKVNLEKTAVVVFRKGGYLAGREKWYYGSDKIAVVGAYKYLGIYFTTRISFTYACQDLICKAKRAVFSILQSMNKFQNDSAEIFFKLFDGQVQPIVQYGSEIWGIEKGEEIEKVHLFAMKRFLRIDSRTPNDIVYGELGRVPIYINSYVACIRYWLKLLQMDQHRLPYKCYKMLYKLDVKGKQTWVTNIRKCLCRYGFMYVWESQGVGCPNTFLKCFKQRLVDCRWQEWDLHINDSDRFSLYRTFKLTNHIESYFTLDINKYVKNALIKFRCGMSSLVTHRRRFKVNTEADLICCLCNTARQDEVHFVLVCPCLSDIRMNLIPSKYFKYPCKFRLVLLLSSSNLNTLKNLALYLYFSFKRMYEVL